jgi:hypothetical protein
MSVDIASERDKYQKVWTYDFYRDQADGDPVVETAFKQMGCKPGESLIDWGCGKGTPARKFQQMGLQVTGFDIANNCLDPDVNIPLVVGCLWDLPKGVKLVADYAFCTDVLEHLPEEHVEDALVNIYTHTVKAAFIQVCTAPDTSGRKMDPPMTLHLTVRSPSWWYDRLSKLWMIRTVESRGKSRSYFVCWH